MAHTLCTNKHSMWNGDEKVCVEAYPVEFVKRISEENPDRKFGDKDTTIPCWWIFMILARKMNQKYGDVWNV